MRGTVALLFFLGCCTGTELETVTIATASQALSFEVEIAKTSQQRARGLMGRTSLAVNRGMLFLFPADTESSFWMKDTPIALDLIFINADGLIVDLIENAEPLSETLLTPDSPYRTVLELPAGTVSQQGMQVGDQVTLPQGVEGVSTGPGGVGASGVAGAGAASFFSA